MEEGVTAVSGPKSTAVGALETLSLYWGSLTCSHLVVGALAWGLQILPQPLVGAHLLSVQSLLPSTLLTLQDPTPAHPKKTVSHREPVRLVLFVFVFGCWFGWLDFDTVTLLCRPNWPGTCYIDQAGLKLAMSLLPLSSGC